MFITYIITIMHQILPHQLHANKIEKGAVGYSSPFI